MSSFLTLNIFHTFFGVSAVDFEQVNVYWDCFTDNGSENLLKFPENQARCSSLIEKLQAKSKNKWM